METLTISNTNGTVSENDYDQHAVPGQYDDVMEEELGDSAGSNNKKI